MEAEMGQRGTNGEKLPKIEYLAIFDHFSPFEPAHGRPFDPTSAFIDITIITGCCCNDICIEKSAPGYYHPIFPPLA